MKRIDIYVCGVYFITSNRKKASIIDGMTSFRLDKETDTALWFSF